jgi:hypothetical protein
MNSNIKNDTIRKILDNTNFNDIINANNTNFNMVIRIILI